MLFSSTYPRIWCPKYRYHVRVCKGGISSTNENKRGGTCLGVLTCSPLTCWLLEFFTCNSQQRLYNHNIGELVSRICRDPIAIDGLDWLFLDQQTQILSHSSPRRHRVLNSWVRWWWIFATYKSRVVVVGVCPTSSSSIGCGGVEIDHSK